MTTVRRVIDEPSSQLRDLDQNPKHKVFVLKFIVLREKINEVFVRKTLNVHTSMTLESYATCLSYSVN